MFRQSTGCGAAGQVSQTWKVPAHSSNVEMDVMSTQSRRLICKAVHGSFQPTQSSQHNQSACRQGSETENRGHQPKDWSCNRSETDQDSPLVTIFSVHLEESSTSLPREQAEDFKRSQRRRSTKIPVGNRVPHGVAEYYTLCRFPMAQQPVSIAIKPDQL